METFPNGAMTGIRLTITNKALSEIQRARPPVQKEYCVVEHGIPAERTAGPPIERATHLLMIHAYPAILLVFDA